MAEMKKTEMKECFGQLANMSIGYRDHTKQYYLKMDQEKLKECDTCHLFTKCMFLKHGELFRGLLDIINKQSGGEGRLRGSG